MIVVSCKWFIFSKYVRNLIFANTVDGPNTRKFVASYLLIGRKRQLKRQFNVISLLQQLEFTSIAYIPLELIEMTKKELIEMTKKELIDVAILNLHYKLDDVDTQVSKNPNFIS